IDLVSHDGELFIVMEYIEGMSLSTLLRLAHKRQLPIPAAVAVKLMIGVLEGLQAAHDVKDESGNIMHLVHRDVSPENILVGVDGYPRILDFGVAKAVGMASTTMEGEIKGKLAYMAPEQLAAKRVTRSTDIFAASIVLWELLTQRRLFKANNIAATAQSVLSKVIPPPSSYQTNLSKKVDGVVLKGLEREWKKRWKSANEFAFSLERSTRVASTREVIQWVKGLGKEELLRRSDLVQAMELTPIDTDDVARLREPASPTVPPPPLPPRANEGTPPVASITSPCRDIVLPPPPLPSAIPMPPLPVVVDAATQSERPTSSVPSPRASDAAVTREARSEEISVSRVSMMAKQPLTAGMAATLFATCTLLIVASITWQRIDVPPENGNHANAASVTRQTGFRDHAVDPRTERSTASVGPTPPKPSALFQAPSAEASADPVEPPPDENADVDGSSATAPSPTDRAVPAPAAKDSSPSGGKATKAKPRRLATSRKGRPKKRKSTTAESLPWAYETKI
ncbi:MAG: protein kinase, partial [Polyangiaceae bacterium]